MLLRIYGTLALFLGWLDLGCLFAVSFYFYEPLGFWFLLVFPVLKYNYYYYLTLLSINYAHGPYYLLLDRY